MRYKVCGFENLYDIDENFVVRNSRTDRVIPAKSGKVTLSKKGIIYVVDVAKIANESITETAKEKLIEEKSKNREYIKTNLSLDKDQKWGMQNKSKIIGDLGEHLVCVELLSRGIRAGINIMEGCVYDVIGDFGIGRIFKIQVKTKIKSTNEFYEFQADIGLLKSCDVMAYVALDERMVVFELCDEIASCGRRFNKRSFIEMSGISIDTVVDKLYSRFENQTMII